MIKYFSLCIIICCSFVSVTASDQTELSVLSWNVYTKKDIKEKIRNKILSWKPDLICLQEAGQKAGLELLRAELSAQSKQEWFLYAPSTQKTSYRQAILSRYPLVSQQTFGRVTDEEKSQPVSAITKAVLQVQVDVAGRLIHVFAIHAATAKKSVAHDKEFAAIVKVIDAASKHTKTLVIGDFNSRSRSDKEPSKGGTAYDTTHSTDAMLAKKYVDTLRAKYAYKADTFIGTKMLKAKKGIGSNQGKRIDYIFCSADLAQTVIDAGIYSQLNNQNKTQDNEFSDHRPVWTRFRFGHK